MSLRAQVLSGLFWTGSGRLLSQILNWGITLYVIRLLSPGDYGLLAMAAVFMSVLVLMGEAGLGPALVQAAELDELKLRRIFGAVILIDSALFALQYAAAPSIADFFDEDRLIPILRVLALQFLLAIVTSIPAASLERSLDFKRQSIVDLSSAVCGGIGTLLFALAGYGVWALVAGSLITALFRAVAINIAAPFLRWPAFSFDGIRSLIAFGGQVTAARLLWLVYSQTDKLIAGKLLGKELLGFYSVSMHLASLPVQKLSSVFNQVAFPAFAQTQHQPDTVSAHVLKGIRILSFFSFPILWGISSIAPEVVLLLLGPKWEPAVDPLQLLPIVMPLTLLSSFLNTAFQGTGRGAVVLRNVLSACLVMPAAFWIGSYWGLRGLCISWLIGFPLVLLLNLQHMLPLVGLKIRAVLKAVALPALAAAGMYACVAVARELVSAKLPAPLLMATLIAAGAGGYVIIALATNAKGVREVVELFRKENPGGRT